MPLRAIARMIQTMLYAKRFFPYYVYNILGGIEEDGEHSYIFTRRLHFGSTRVGGSFNGAPCSECVYCGDVLLHIIRLRTGIGHPPRYHVYLVTGVTDPGAQSILCSMPLCGWMLTT